MPSKKYSLEEFRIALSDRNLTAVARKTGLSSLTIQNIVNKKADYMSLRTHDKLVAYLFPEDEK